MKAGSGDWRLGWQSNPAAHAPEMAILSCLLPRGAAQMRVQHTSAPLAGAALAMALAGARSLFIYSCLQRHVSRQLLALDAPT